MMLRCLAIGRLLRGALLPKQELPLGPCRPIQSGRDVDGTSGRLPGVHRILHPADAPPRAIFSADVGHDGGLLNLNKNEESGREERQQRRR